MDTIVPSKELLNELFDKKMAAKNTYHNTPSGRKKANALAKYIKAQTEYETLRVQLAVKSKLHTHHDPNAEIVSLDKEDIVNNPSHYTQDGEIECIDAIRAALGPDGFRAFCRGNAMKYIWRSELKTGDPTTDLRKAEWYMNRAAKEAGA